MSEEEWEALQRHFSMTRGPDYLEGQISRLVKRGMTREEAIHYLYVKTFEKRRIERRKALALLILIVTVAAAVPAYYFGSSIFFPPKVGNASQTLIGIEYETWFPYPMGWNLREATPTLGTYNSSDPNVIEQHAEWLSWAGINFIVVDWSNNVWQSSPSSRDNWHNGIAFAIINATSRLLQVYHDMSEEGLQHPKVVILVGLDNGPGANVTELNMEAKWIYRHYVENEIYNQSLLYYEGKPLLLVLDTAMAGGWSDPNFTVRYMGAQLQVTGDSMGYWSWMDGSIDPTVAYRDGNPEAVTVTPAFFGPQGWLGSGAVGRRNGATYIQEWKVPLKYKPRFILICQWNEFAGQPNGSSIYTDCYSVQYSNDIEPTQLDGWGYRGRGGWGYYYLALTKALIELYRGITPNATVMVISSPLYNSTLSGWVTVQWTYVGVAPKSFSVYVNGHEVVASLLPSTFSYSIPSSYLIVGRNVVTVVGNGATCYFNLTRAWYAIPSEKAMPAQASVEFYYKG
ncbi:MAG: hypothetical protein ACP5GO_06055 [Thermoprotei archaeon]